MKTKRVVNAIALCMIISLLTACGTYSALQQEDQTITLINSDPPGAQVWYMDSCLGTTPVEYEFSSIMGVDTLFHFFKDSYIPQNYRLRNTWQTDARLQLKGMFFTDYVLMPVYYGHTRFPGSAYLVPVQMNVSLSTWQAGGDSLIDMLLHQDEAVRQDAIAIFNILQDDPFGGAKYICDSNLLERMSLYMLSDSTDVSSDVALAFSALGSSASSACPALAEDVLAVQSLRKTIKAEKRVNKDDHRV